MGLTGRSSPSWVWYCCSGSSGVIRKNKAIMQFAYRERVVYFGGNPMKYKAT